MPHKRQRRTRGMIARARGLEPLADRILAQPTSGNPAIEAAAFVDPEKDVADVDAVLAGARDIVAEIAAENATVRAAARQMFTDQGELVSKAVPKNTKQPTKFEQYYDFREPVKTIPSHRFLAIVRGERDKVLRAHVEVDSARLTSGHRAYDGGWLQARRLLRSWPRRFATATSGCSHRASRTMYALSSSDARTGTP